jgi:hypothetical protein
MRRSPWLAFAAWTIVLAGANSGCAPSGGSSNQASSVVVTASVPAGVLSGTTTVTYALSGSGTADVVVMFSTDSGATWNGATPANGCPTTKQRSAPSSATFLWDTVADGADGNVLIRVAAGASSAIALGTVSNPGLTFLDRSASVDAGTTSVTFPAPHRGHYDLSPTRLSFSADPTLAARIAALPVTSWRISVGRWEVGPVSLLAPEPASYSRDPNLLRSCTREFYRGPNSLAGAADPANYAFSYLDAAIAAVTGLGAEPYLCFDYMPFTLAANQDPDTGDNLYPANADLSFSNGIRTSRPADDAVYAEVVKRVVMHVNGTFANGLGRSIRHIEIGNEPDLVDGSGTPTRYFWTGTRAQFLSMYQACASALDAQFGSSIAISAGSFAFQPNDPAPTFISSFLSGLGAARMDAVSFHAYDDDPVAFFASRLSTVASLRDTYRPAAKLHCTEWGMALTGGSKFDDMTCALHHARALEYFLLFGVERAHRALVRDIVPGVAGQMGTITTAPARIKPAGEAFRAYELLAGTPTACAITAIAPAGKPMLVVGRSADAVTAVFFHEKPPAGQVGRMTLDIANPMSGGYRLDRYVLTDATAAIGDGLWRARSRLSSGPVAETLYFTDDTLVVLRLSSGTGGATAPAALRAVGAMLPR